MPAPAPSPEPPGVTYGPEPIQVRPIVVVLGPGVARGLAHAGVLRALADAKIPVAAIFGTEMGALIGAIYALQPSINGFEWEVQKLREQVILDKKRFLGFSSSGALSSGRRYDEFLKQCFGAKDLKQSSVPVRVLVREAGTDRVAMLGEGGAVEAIRGATAEASLFESVAWAQGKKVQSATEVRAFPVSEAKALGMGPVVVVDVIGSLKEPRLPGKEGYEKAERVLADQLELGARAGTRDLQSADLVIEPDLRGIGVLDFEKRSEAVFRGKAAVSAALGRLRQLSGLPPEP